MPKHVEVTFVLKYVHDLIGNIWDWSEVTICNITVSTPNSKNNMLDEKSSHLVHICESNSSHWLSCRFPNTKLRRTNYPTLLLKLMVLVASLHKDLGSSTHIISTLLRRFCVAHIDFPPTPIEEFIVVYRVQQWAIVEEWVKRRSFNFLTLIHKPFSLSVAIMFKFWGSAHGLGTEWIRTHKHIIYSVSLDRIYIMSE